MKRTMAVFLCLILFGIFLRSERSLTNLTVFEESFLGLTAT